MEKKAVRFDFDMDRKGYLVKMQKYNSKQNWEEDSIKNDKNYFAQYYDINLSSYVNEKGKSKGKFIIPYEMADLYCLMMNAMKSSPTYDKRTKKSGHSLGEIIDHNKMVIESLDNLPSQLSDYIKMTPEYYNAICLINYVPVIIDRMSALLYLILDTNDIPLNKTLEYLVDGLDDVYERFFWEKTRKEVVIEWINKNKEHLKNLRTIDETVPTLETYHLIDYMLANFFKTLNRDKWPESAEATVNELLEKLKETYKGDNDKDIKIKNDYLCWLCDQKWHELYKTIANPIRFPTENLIKVKLSEYNARYNAQGKISRECDNDAISQIEESLQNIIDVYIIHELLSSVSDIEAFKKAFDNPSVKKLSNYLYLHIKELLNGEQSDNISESLKFFLNNVYPVLNSYDDKYKRYGLWNYAEEVLNGKNFRDCCLEIYRDVYVKIQCQKCEQFNKNKKKSNELKEILEGTTGKLFTDISKKDVS
jgi:hypothetical protein